MSAQTSWLVERPAWAWNSLEKSHLNKGRRKQRPGAQIRSLPADLAWNFTFLTLGGHNAISTIQSPLRNDYDTWQFHRGLKAANSFRTTRTSISDSRHGNDVSLIFARGGRHAQPEPGVRSEIVRVFHARLIEREMPSKKPQLTASRCDPQSRPKAQARTWANLFHTPLNRSRLLSSCLFEARSDWHWSMISLHRLFVCLHDLLTQNKKVS